MLLFVNLNLRLQVRRLQITAHKMLKLFTSPRNILHSAVLQATVSSPSLLFSFRGASPVYPIMNGMDGYLASYLFL